MAQSIGGIPEMMFCRILMSTGLPGPLLSHGRHLAIRIAPTQTADCALKCTVAGTPPHSICAVGFLSPVLKQVQEDCRDEMG